VALELSPPPHPDRPSSLNNFAAVLRKQFEQSGQHGYLDQAISTFHESLDALIHGHPSTCSISTNLGEALMCAYSHTHELEYLDKAIVAYRTAVACDTAPTSERFHAATSWAHFADSIHESALEAYHTAIEFLPRLAMVGLDLQSRQQALMSGTDGLARDAAACAICSGQYDQAVELLESGRGVFWSQALQLRSSTTDLSEVAPELEKELRHISFALEQGSLWDVSRNMSHSPQKVMSMEKEASHYHHLNDQWLATLHKVRQLDGFQDFLRPSRLSALQGAVADGSVVVLNASKTGCAALVLTTTGVQHVPLPDLSLNQVIELTKLIRYAIAKGDREPQANHIHFESLVPFISDTLQLLRESLERHLGRASNTSVQADDIFRYVLGVLWVSVVEPIIRLLALEVNSKFLSPIAFSAHCHCRNLMIHLSYGGAPQANSLFFQYTQQGCT
jgi:hypothetical protein